MTDEYTGHRAITSSGSEHNTERLHVEKVLAEHRTNIPVKILKIYPGKDGVAPTADVQVLIDQVDGLGASATPHAVVYGVLVGRTHSGSGAIVSDPVVGDMYHMAVADRDLTKLKNTGQQSSPDSKRRGSLSDGMLTHAIMAGKPSQAVEFKPGGGIKVFDKGGAVIETSADGKTVTVIPADGGTVILGGDGKKGTYGFVMTDQGVSSVVKAKL